MSKKDEYFTMMEAQIKKWDAEVDKLRARSHEVSTEARAKYDEQIKAMRASRDAANKKLQEMRAASESGGKVLTKRKKEKSHRCNIF